MSNAKELVPKLCIDRQEKERERENLKAQNSEREINYIKIGN